MIEVGQVLLLKILYDNQGTAAEEAHPCLIVDVNEEDNVLEIVQFDSLEGKEYKAAFKETKVVLCTNPNETVIDKDSFVNLNTKYQIKIFSELEYFMRQKDKLSKDKLDDVLLAYKAYHLLNKIFDNKIVYISQSCLLELNR